MQSTLAFKPATRSACKAGRTGRRSSVRLAAGKRDEAGAQQHVLSGLLAGALLLSPVADYVAYTPAAHADEEILDRKMTAVERRRELLRQAREKATAAAANGDAAPAPAEEPEPAAPSVTRPDASSLKKQAAKVYEKQASKAFTTKDVAPIPDGEANSPFTALMDKARSMQSDAPAPAEEPAPQPAPAPAAPKPTPAPAFKAAPAPAPAPKPAPAPAPPAPKPAAPAADSGADFWKDLSKSLETPAPKAAPAPAVEMRKPPAPEMRGQPAPAAKPAPPPPAPVKPAPAPSKPAPAPAKAGPAKQAAKPAAKSVKKRRGAGLPSWFSEFGVLGAFGGLGYASLKYSDDIGAAFERLNKQLEKVGTK